MFVYFSPKILMYFLKNTKQNKPVKTPIQYLFSGFYICVIQILIYSRLGVFYFNFSFDLIFIQ